MASPGSRLDVFLLKAEPIGFAIDKLDMVERRRGDKNDTMVVEHPEG